MKVLLWTAAITAVVYAVFAPFLLTALPLLSGASSTWIVIDPRPLLALGPWAIVIWPVADMLIEVGLYVATVASVCIAVEAWRSFTHGHGTRQAQRLTLRHQF